VQKTLTPQARKYRKASPRFFSAGVRGPGSTVCGFFSRRKVSRGWAPGAGTLGGVLKANDSSARRKCEKLNAFASANDASRRKLFFFVAAEKLVALNGGDDADGAFVAGLGALNAAEAADAYGAG